MIPPSTPHPAALDAEALLRQCDVERSRASGPGGQHRNKVETAIRITHRPSGVTAWASERRSQAENQRVALFRLRVKLALHVRRDPDAKAGPSALWRSRCPKGRIAVNPSHADFPTLLAEALDGLATCRWEPKPAADWLACTPSQLVKLLQAEPAALAHVNAERQKKGQHPLR